ncbi:1-deoxy-D-xylulose-5-phosphate reductoisomerase [Thiohalomonas denitrificans]|uniref:1-deoxy-D-xylulose-5-phosphate reductoisomerase n=1 Tax=Thiohalomonas denitrificans TaxID=415747 RepID=UPI0026EB64F0|nr:1-deoxy-D-xylulose-5-phosphate reductoisomerase [Thiohalomonas denitrificans]
MIGVTVLGATGSIGMSTLDVLSRHPNRYRVVALTANSRVDRLVEQCVAFRPRYAAMVDETAAEQLAVLLRELAPEVEVLAGQKGLETVAALDEAEVVMAAIVGAAGLRPSLAAARAGKRILLANKEALVMSGALFMEEVRRNGAELLPIDSEHNAIFQCMPHDFARGLDKVGINRILLTASGGPFRNLPLSELGQVTPEQAVAHPNWSMGRKISVDSATMMNKGLEVIEACWLFGTRTDRIQVVLHPQSIIHSMVSYIDGSVIAQMGNPDMRTPIAHALAWPERIRSGVESLDVFQVARLDFEPPDLQRFPCLRLAGEAMDAGGTCPAVLNAANEIAVAAFLEGSIPFTAIPQSIEYTLGALPRREAEDLTTIFEEDAAARRVTSEWIRLSYPGAL